MGINPRPLGNPGIQCPHDKVQHLTTLAQIHVNLNWATAESVQFPQMSSSVFRYILSGGAQHPWGKTLKETRNAAHKVQKLINGKAKKDSYCPLNYLLRYPRSNQQSPDLNQNPNLDIFCEFFPSALGTRSPGFRLRSISVGMLRGWFLPLCSYWELTPGPQSQLLASHKLKTVPLLYKGNEAFCGYKEH